MPQNIYEVLCIFLTYGFIGWCVEVAYAAVDRGEFVNRGFLNGPCCPLYGFGMVILSTLLAPLQDNFLLLFGGSFLFISLLEYLTGLILEKVFHNKWWDYSDKPFNIHGYICLEFSLIWGLGGVFMMEVIHPFIYGILQKIPFKIGIWILVPLLIIFAVDCCVTVTTILQFNRRISTLDKMAESIHKLSDELGEGIYEGVTLAKEKSEELQQEGKELKEKVQQGGRELQDKLQQESRELKEKVQQERKELQEKLDAKREEYNRLLNEKKHGYKRLLKAFPNMKSEKYDEMLKKYRQHLNQIWNKKHK